MNTENPLEIKRIKTLSPAKANELNPLLDEGTTWDVELGAKFLLNGDNALYVAYWQGEAVGFLTAYRLQRFDARKAEVLLYEIGVSENHQRKGIGKALIKEVQKWAQEVEADEVWVLTHRSNAAAMALYTSAGGSTEDDDEQMFVFKL